MASTSARVDNARRSPGERLSGMVRTLLGLNNSVLTDSRNIQVPENEKRGPSNGWVS